MDEILITLPLPARALSPNARPHYMALSSAKKKYRALSCLTTKAAGGYEARWTRASSKATFYWPDRRDRDFDNAAASLKSAFDGMKDAGLFIDDCARVLTHEPTEFHIDGKNPRVEIRIKKL